MRKKTKEHIQNARNTLLTIMEGERQGEVLRNEENFKIQISGASQNSKLKLLS